MPRKPLAQMTDLELFDAFYDGRRTWAVDLEALRDAAMREATDIPDGKPLARMNHSDLFQAFFDASREGAVDLEALRDAAMREARSTVGGTP